MVTGRIHLAHRITHGTRPPPGNALAANSVLELCTVALVELGDVLSGSETQ